MPTNQSDGYKLIRQVGSGVAGAVWMADGPAGRVAMRRFASPAPQGGDEWLADRAHFLQAGKQCLAFRHPKVVPVLDVVDDSDDAWIASEFVEDETLESILKHEQLTAAEASRILRSAAQVLDQAHRGGMVHGDLKPSKIYIDGKKSVRIAGFAISPRARRSPRAELNAGWIHPYLTPEHLIAPGTIGPRSDVYALAAIAYLMFTGKPPFSAGGDIRAAILRGQVDTPGGRPLRGGLEAPLFKAMSRDPSQRFADCSELAGAAEVALASASLAGGDREGASSAKLIYVAIGSLVAAMIVAALLLLHGPRKTEIAKVEPHPASGPIAVAPPPAATGDIKPTKKTRSSGQVQVAASNQGGGTNAGGTKIASNEDRRNPFGSGGAQPPTRSTSPTQTVDRGRIFDKGRDVGVKVLPTPKTDPPVIISIDPSAPKGYSLAVYSRYVDTKHLIGDGNFFSYLDPNLGEMGKGDLKAKIMLNPPPPPPAKGHVLGIVWEVDSRVVDLHKVSPNTVDEFGSEPIRGQYRVLLVLDGNINSPLAKYSFRITP